MGVRSVLHRVAYGRLVPAGLRRRHREIERGAEDESNARAEDGGQPQRMNGNGQDGLMKQCRHESS
jgi:hypothetical protein